MNKYFILAQVCTRRTSVESLNSFQNETQLTATAIYSEDDNNYK